MTSLLRVITDRNPHLITLPQLWLNLSSNHSDPLTVGASYNSDTTFASDVLQCHYCIAQKILYKEILTFLVKL